MIPKVTKENMLKALAILNAELVKEQNLKRVYRSASALAHPDKQAGTKQAGTKQVGTEQVGTDEVFQVIHAISESFIAVAEHGKKATKEQKMDLAGILKKLPKDTQDLIINKLTKEQPELTKNSILNPVVYTVYTRYAYFAGTPRENRFHALEVKSGNFENLKDDLKDLNGDFLKTQILENFRTQIENTSSKEELDALKQQLKDSVEYGVLKTGQGLFTRITGIQTTSQKTLETMFEEQEKNLEYTAFESTLSEQENNLEYAVPVMLSLK
jgi:hypothetical protein